MFDFLSNAFLGFSDMMFCNRKALKDTQNIVDIETLSLKSYQSLSKVAPSVIFDSVLSDNLNGYIPINYQVLHQAKTFNRNCKIFHAEYLMEENDFFWDFRASECYLAHYPNCVQSFIFD